VSVWFGNSESHSIGNELLFIGRQRAGWQCLTPDQGIDIGGVNFVEVAMFDVIQDAYGVPTSEGDFLGGAVSNGNHSLASLVRRDPVGAPNRKGCCRVLTWTRFFWGGLGLAQDLVSRLMTTKVGDSRFHWQFWVALACPVVQCDGGPQEKS
jgi:hypothetical protein